MPKKTKALKFTPGEGYAELVRNVKAEFSELEKLVRTRTAQVLWKVGRFTHVHLLKNKKRAGYGQGFYEKFAKDTGRDTTTLQRAVQFYRTYPILAEQRQLSWHHYKSLITIKDEAKRNFFAQKATKKGWTYEELSEAIRLDRLKYDEPEEKPAQSTDKLSVTRARIYTYQILEPSYIHPIEERLVIDLGFTVIIQAEVKGIRLKQGEMIESIKSGDKYSFKHSDATKKELYTYKALVERVVDADTIWLNIDLGFSCWSRQKVRLRGIDAPEIDTQKGQEAKEFVEARLKEVDFVIIKTHKSDKYDRYLADIFYLKDEDDSETVLEQGTFLNQELLNLGLAKIESD